MRLAPSTLRRAALAAAACGSLLLSPLSPTLAGDAAEGAAPAEAPGEPPPDDAAEDEGADGDAPSAPLRRTPEVTVTATRAEREVLEVPGNVTVLDREDIEESGAKDVPDLLRRESGLFVTNTTSNSGGYTVAPRGFLNGGGFGGTNVLVLVDGRRVNEPSSSSADWALIPMENVERIEIVRGPASAVYGDNAVGGVIQIITRRPEGPLSVELDGEVGTFDREGGSLSVRGEEGPVGFSLFARGFSTDAFRDEADFRDRDLRGKLRFDLGDTLSATVSAGYASDDRGLPGDLLESEIDALGRDAAEPRFFQDSSDTRVRFGEVRLDWTPTERTKGEILAFHRKRTTSAEFSSTPPFAPSLTRIDTETDATGVNTRFETGYDLLGLEARSVLGVDLLREDLDQTSSFGPSRTRRVVGGGYLQQEVALTPRLRLSGGLRYDDADYDIAQGMPETQVERQLGEWSPKAALVYQVAEPASLYASYAKGTRFPNIDEVAGVIFGSPELEPQRSNSYEVGLKIRAESLEGNVALYHMNVQDEIFFDPLSGAFGQNVNLDRAQHRGVETSLRLTPVEWLELYGSYTFDDTTVEDAPRSALEGEPVPLTPEHRGNAGAVLHLPLSFELTVNGNYVGSRSVGGDVSNSFDELSKYARYDAQLSFHPELREGLSLELRAGVRNLFDREYREFASTPFGGMPPIGSFPAAGRHYELGATLRWR